MILTTFVTISALCYLLWLINMIRNCGSEIFELFLVSDWQDRIALFVITAFFMTFTLIVIGMAAAVLIY